MPFAQRLGWGRTQCDTVLLGEALPKIHTVGLSIPPAQNTYVRAPSLPYPTTPLTLRSPKPNYGQLTLKGQMWGVLFAPPILGPLASNHKYKKNWGAILGNPILGPSGSLALFCSFALLSISGPPGPPSHLPISNLSPANPPILGQT